MPSKINDVAQASADRLKNAIDDMRCLPADGVRGLPIITGLAPDGTTTANIDNVLHEIGSLLIETKRLYVFGDSVVMEAEYNNEKRLVTLATACRPEPGAAARLGSLFKCKFERRNKDVEYLPNSTTAGLVLAHEPTLARLPKIEMYAKRPVFDKEYRLCGPGWHADEGILVHGPEVAAEPTKPPAPASAESKACDRLPPNLKTLLGEFCFQTDADLANALAVLLTGILMPKFIVPGHALVQIDGNRPNVGKSKLAEAIAGILDGAIPSLLWYSENEEELEKCICAQLRENPGQTSLIFDNARRAGERRIESAVVELNSMASGLSFRVLGGSTVYKRPNDVLWFFTMNNSKLNEDLTSRCIPIRLRWEGDPTQRTFHGPTPPETAIKYRSEILGELAGMVLLWNQLGRPMGTREHRLKTWSSVITGILEANGFPEVLTNLKDAANEFNAELDDLMALAEAALSNRRHFFQAGSTTSKANELQTAMVRFGQNPAQWANLFKDANVLQDKLNAAKSEASKSKLISNFLGKYIDRQVSVKQGDLDVTAILRKAQGSGNKTLYCFQVFTESAPEVSGAPAQVASLVAGVATDFASRRPRTRLTRTTQPVAKAASSPGEQSTTSGTTAEGGNNLEW